MFLIIFLLPTLLRQHGSNVMAEQIALLLHIQEDPGSYLGLETNYPD
jgi:hypothetical protein